MKTYGYDTKLPENYTSHYRFAAEDSPNLLEQGETAKKVSLYLSLIHIFMNLHV